LAVIYSRLLYAPCDDAYIFLVYAKNLIQGNGLTFNGMVVEGFSSPLWVALISIFGLSGIDLPVLMQILSTLSGLFALFATYALSTVLLKEQTEQYQYWSLIPPALLAATGDFAFYLGSGLEQILFTGLIALGAAYFAKKSTSALNSITLPVILALAILTRPEGVLFAMAVFIQGIFVTKSIRPSIKSGLKLTAILAPILLLKRLYFGYWLPNTYYIKSGSGLANTLHGKVYLAQNLPRYLAVVILFALFFIISLRPKTRPIVKQIGWMVAFSLLWGVYIYLNGGDNLVGGRMLVPVLPLVYTCLVLLVQKNRVSIGIAGAAMLILSVIFIYGYAQDNYVQSHITRWQNNYKTRFAAGIYLKENFPPDTLIALNPAGIIPYYAELPTIDMLGLNNVYIAHSGKRDTSLPFGHQAGDGEYVLSQDPDILFFGGTAAKQPGDFISDREIAASDEFITHYQRKTWRGIGYPYLRVETQSP
jgi:hypothetical protein